MRHPINSNFLVVFLLGLILFIPFYPANADDQEPFTVNVPNAQGSYTPVVITRSGTGFVGPQGEYYAKFPSVAQLRMMYASADVEPTAASNQAIELPQADARVNYFYDSLKPYGQWIQHDRYGWVWSPYNVSIEWRPYTEGHWEYTDYGWTWVSDLPWGWACFHYGRWFYDDYRGWLWYPDTVWAPSWVVWRRGGGWVGWAPLPPEAIWREDRGLEFAEADILPWYAYSFVEIRFFTHHDLAHRCIRKTDNRRIIHNTMIMDNSVTVFNHHVVNQVPFHHDIVKAAKHPITPLRVVPVDSPQKYGVVDGKQLRVFRLEKFNPLEKKTLPFESRKNIETIHSVSSPQTVQALPLTVAQPSSPQFLKSRQVDERSVQKFHENQKQVLIKQQQDKTKHPVQGITKDPLIQANQLEQKAFQEELKRQQQLLKNYQGQSIKNIAVPQPQPQVQKSKESAGLPQSPDVN